MTPIAGIKFNPRLQTLNPNHQTLDPGPLTLDRLCRYTPGRNFSDTLKMFLEKMMTPSRKVNIRLPGKGGNSHGARPVR